MLLASVDVGSNTVRLLVGEVSKGRVTPQRHELSVTRLAGGIEKSGKLNREAAEKTLRTLKNYSDIMASEGVERASAIGTSALREAADSLEFIEKVKGETGLVIDVVSGRKEADLTVLGVCSSLYIGNAAVVLDIGGGSTELICTQKAEIRSWVTVPIGAVKLLERHIRSDPPSSEDLEGLDLGVDQTVSMIFKDMRGHIPKGVAFVATAGTATTVASVDLGLLRYDRARVHGHIVGISRLKEMFKEMSSMTIRERANIRGLEPSRADLIITGIKITIKLMETMGFETMTVSDQGLLEGALIELHYEASR